MMGRASRIISGKRRIIDMVFAFDELGGKKNAYTPFVSSIEICPASNCINVS
jgi:hypothetical protein